MQCQVDLFDKSVQSILLLVYGREFCVFLNKICNDGTFYHKFCNFLLHHSKIFGKNGNLHIKNMLHFFLIESNYKKKSQIEKLIYEFGVSETKNEKLI